MSEEEKSKSAEDELAEFAAAVEEQKAVEAVSKEGNISIDEAAAKVQDEESTDSTESQNILDQDMVSQLLQQQDSAEASAEAAEETAEVEAAAEVDAGNIQETTGLKERVSSMDMPTRSREMTVSTLVRLMGIPAKSQVELIDKKVDNLTVKVNLMTSRVDRLASQFNEVFHDFHRIDVQISDLREFMKNAVTAIAGSADQMKSAGKASGNGKKSSEKPKAESSEAAK